VCCAFLVADHDPFAGEAVRRSRVRAVKQARVTHWEDIELFLKAHKPKPFKVVIKPIRSAGSDNVYLCESEDELKTR
jgi:glutathione synthase/RimK-type ligase-like ATP-grasp enzyme